VSESIRCFMGECFEALGAWEDCGPAIYLVKHLQDTQEPGSEFPVCGECVIEFRTGKHRVRTLVA
jgi:hypothetical protein